MAPRLELHALLKSLLGSEHAYFQPPPSVQMQYPAIVYHLDRMHIVHADNLPYKRKHRYQIVVIDRDPDSKIPEKIAELSTVSFDRSYVVDGLNHTAFNLFF